MDAEPLTRLWPWGALILLSFLIMLIWLRPLRATVDVTLKHRWNGGHPMAPTKVPEGMTLFENYATFKICDNGRYIFAGMSKGRGIVVFDTQRVLYEMPSGDWGAPALEWRPSDNQLIVISVSEGGTSIQIDAVPGVFRGG